LSFELPVPQPPAYTQIPVFGRYDYTGIPLYVFTETTRVSPVLVKAITLFNERVKDIGRMALFIPGVWYLILGLKGLV
ncbi:MAG: hypothetical protein KKH28_03205, partial [Elusimicrobia bacterium]|nr:hypothetical protein [Elusimicrobiota bacterium]